MASMRTAAAAGGRAPGRPAVEGAPRATAAGYAAVRKGYTLVTWTRQGLTYWAISDLDAGELQTLQRLL